MLIFIENLINYFLKKINRKSQSQKESPKKADYSNSEREREEELLKCLGGLDLKLGARSHSDNPIRVRELLMSEEVLSQIPEEDINSEQGFSLNQLREQQTTKDSTSEEEDDVEYRMKHKLSFESNGKMMRSGSAPDLQKVILGVLNKVKYYINSCLTASQQSRSLQKKTRRMRKKRNSRLRTLGIKLLILNQRKFLSLTVQKATCRPIWMSYSFTISRNCWLERSKVFSIKSIKLREEADS